MISHKTAILTKTNSDNRNLAIAIRTLNRFIERSIDLVLIGSVENNITLQFSSTQLDSKNIIFSITTLSLRFPKTIARAFANLTQIFNQETSSLPIK